VSGGAADRIGLCPNCAFARIVRSAKGSRFYLCRRAETDPRFPKYPRLPVLRCEGYEPGQDERAGGSR